MQRTLLLAAALLLFASCAETPPPGINVIPRPVSVEPGDGVFRIGRSCRIGYDDPALQSVAGLCAGYLAEAGVRKPVVTDKPVHRGVDLQLDATLAGEAYALSVTPRGVTVCGGSSRAVLYGVQTLRQLVDGGRVPVVEIRDEPCFGYRGAMFDVARYFYPVEDVKRFIDIMALHKLNTFHWHLTDDQGWRIEIRRYPELTRVGSVRRETLIGHYKTSDRYDGTPHGGYYTQDEIREVVAYAAERCIEVIPEIELPGHSMAALASYPWLGCTKGPYEVRTTWFYSSDVLCAGRETTFEFLENVLAEVLELFPSKYIHIGGDECPKVRWEKCPDCRRRIRQEGLKDGDDLQSYFVSRIEKWLHACGREMIGWDELLEGGVTPSTIVMSWRGAEGGIKAAKLGNRVVMSPRFYFYLDYYQTSDPESNGEPLSIGRNIPIRKLYGYDPFDELDEAQGRNILGIQANLWTEYIATMDHAEYMLLPRLAAMSEVAWAPRGRDYDDFVRRLGSLRRLYDRAGYRYADFVFRGVE